MERKETTIREGKIENRINTEEKMIEKGVQIEDRIETERKGEIKNRMTITKDQPENSDKVYLYILRST